MHQHLCGKTLADSWWTVCLKTEVSLQTPLLAWSLCSLDIVYSFWVCWNLRCSLSPVWRCFSLVWLHYSPNTRSNGFPRVLTFITGKWYLKKSLEDWWNCSAGKGSHHTRLMTQIQSLNSIWTSCRKWVLAHPFPQHIRHTHIHTNIHTNNNNNNKNNNNN